MTTELDGPKIAKLASQSVTPNLTRQLGEELDTAKNLLAQAIQSFTRLDHLVHSLAEHGLTFKVDLGEVGNSALTTHRLVAAAKDRPGFSLPRQAA